MKIAFLNYYSGHLNRGGETFVAELAKQLAKGNDIRIFHADPGQAVSVSSLPTIHFLRRLFINPERIRELLFTLKTLPAITKWKPEIVFPINGGWQALICSLYCRFSGARLVIAGHSGPGWDDRWNLLMKPHLFIALTSSQLAWARRATIYHQEFALIPNGVDLAQFRRAGKKFHIDLERPITLLVAATTPDKRVEQGIRAIASLKKGSLLLLGKGPLDERINKLGYGLLGQNRFFHTAVSYDQMPEYYRSADLFTLCSVGSEAFGIVYLEAMATNLPCVATNDASRREIIGKAGVFVDNPDDSKEYGLAISTALKKNWHDLPRTQASSYSWQTVTEKYEKALDQLTK